ncbi:MAG: GMP reductase, partial [Candidatus Izimaplasma sp.]|nr:GMP reductase [Candidatus Izimaplasma bacterium]
MRMESDIKLDFKDVLIRPKRSNLSSRKEVSLKRTYTFKYSHKEWTGIPVMTANMDGVGTLEMAEELQKRQVFTCLVKSYDETHFKGFNINPDYVALSTGISKNDYKRVKAILKQHPELYFICIDVANGYSEKF